MDAIGLGVGFKKEYMFVVVDEVEVVVEGVVA